MPVFEPLPPLSTPWWTLERGAGPLMAVALHAGHDLRREVAERLAIDDVTRRREEDPFTDVWADVAPTRMRVHRSRFEVDLNRPREQAVYRGPDEAWGLDLWKEPPGAALVERSLHIWDTFYQALQLVMRELEERYGRFVVLDLHSYNLRRDDDRWSDDPLANPQINLGTGSMPRARWAPVVDAFAAALETFELDVRENVRFQGGHLARWTHATFPTSGCVIAVECRKTFMSEDSGALDPTALRTLHAALAVGALAVRGELAR